jgi:dTDP-4-dehydrorhamnose 3,5-epimerase
MHLQLGEFAQTKRLRVIRGEIIDFIASMIPGDDPNEVLQFRMTPGQELTVPKGWAHGFATLQPDTIVQYVIDEPYEPTIEQSIHWKSWRPIRKVLNELTSLQISPKDQIAPELIEVYQKISETYKHLTQ